MTAPSTSGAALSDDRLQRYTLFRRVREDSERVCLFLGVNASTADEDADDATIRRMKAFAADQGCGWLAVANLLSQRTPQVSELLPPSDDVRALTDLYLVLLALSADVVICGWGPPGKLPVGLRLRWIEVVDLLQALDVEMYALHVTKDGHPGHPLYLPADAQLVRWPKGDGCL